MSSRAAREAGTRRSSCLARPRPSSSLRDRRTVPSARFLPTIARRRPRPLSRGRGTAPSRGGGLPKEGARSAWCRSNDRRERGGRAATRRRRRREGRARSTTLARKKRAGRGGATSGRRPCRKRAKVRLDSEERSRSVSASPRGGRSLFERVWDVRKRFGERRRSPWAKRCTSLLSQRTRARTTGEGERVDERDSVGGDVGSRDDRRLARPRFDEREPGPPPPQRGKPRGLFRKPVPRSSCPSS